MSVFLWWLLAFVGPAAVAHAVDVDSLAPGIYAEIRTPRGTMLAELFYQRVPLIVANFVGLAEGTLGPNPGKPFYDSLIFHRVVPGFVVQGGDPGGTGEGGPGYTLPDEFDPSLSHDAAGYLSMANDGPDTNGSQFFITLAPATRLDFLHSIFGRVIDGLDVLPRIQQGDTMEVLIHREGEEARRFRADSVALKKARQHLPLLQHGSTPHFEDPDGLLPTVPPRAKAMNQKLGNLERSTGVRVFAQIFASTKKTSPASAEAEIAALARELGVENDGALAVYQADHDTWKIYLGRNDARVLEGTAPPTDGSGSRVESELLLRAAEREKGWIAEAGEKSGELTPPQRIRLKVESVLQELISALLRSRAAKTLEPTRAGPKTAAR